MASPAASPELLGLFERLLPAFWVERMPKTGTGSRQGIYSFAVVVWLMIVQRLDAKGTLGGALQQMLPYRPASLHCWPNSRPVRQAASSLFFYWMALP